MSNKGAPNMEWLVKKLKKFSDSTGMFVKTKMKFVEKVKDAPLCRESGRTIGVL
jgi:hypothetical protein